MWMYFCRIANRLEQNQLQHYVVPNLCSCLRAQDKVCIFISKMPIFSPHPMYDHLLESSHRDGSNKWSNIGFGKEISQVEFKR